MRTWFSSAATGPAPRSSTRSPVRICALGAVIADVEWVLHAAVQDLPCLAELGLRPDRLFDTELAGRLLGYERVGLGTIVEEVLGYRLEKGHSAVDWSTRPLPEPWLRYAALDVEVLIELRDALESELRAAGKLDWAHQEFAAIAAAPLPHPDATRGGVRPGSTGPAGHAAGHRASSWEARDRVASSATCRPAGCCPTRRSSRRH